MRANRNTPVILIHHKYKEVDMYLFMIKLMMNSFLYMLLNSQSSMKMMIFMNGLSVKEIKVFIYFLNMKVEIGKRED
jgi:hypothetical protein